MYLFQGNGLAGLIEGVEIEVSKILDLAILLRCTYFEVLVWLG